MITSSQPPREVRTFGKTSHRHVTDVTLRRDRPIFFYSSINSNARRTIITKEISWKISDGKFQTWYAVNDRLEVVPVETEFMGYDNEGHPNWVNVASRKGVSPGYDLFPTRASAIESELEPRKSRREKLRSEIEKLEFQLMYPIPQIAPDP